MKKILLIIISLTALLTSTAYAEIPAGYYSSLKGKTEAALKTALFNIINPHTEVSSYQALPSYFEKTDLYPNSTRWWDMYSDIPLYLPWSGSKLNREHSLPKSWWGGSTSTPAYVDLNHLYPAEAIANQRKSNYPLGEVTGKVYYTNGFISVGVGANSGGAQYVFEPNDEYKGDFARTYFYMVTCYQNMTWTNTCQVMNGTYPSLQSWAVQLLLKWHRADPVSQKELDRNEEVYKIQGNRNPFIDDPELAEYIWGNKKGQAYTPGGSSETPGGTPNLITPPNGMALEFNQVAVGHTTTAQLQFKSEYCTGYFELALTGMNKGYFTISENTVQTSASNTVAGKWITITYKPTSVGKHTAGIVITEGGLDEGSRLIKLTGECLAVPTLSRLTAQAATDVAQDTYVAHWDTPPADEVVDYYMVTVKRYKDGNVTTIELPAETDSLLVDGLSEGDYDTYAVQSVRLGIRSEMSNYVTVRPAAAIDEILVEEPLVVESFPGMLRFRCGNPQTDLTVYDIAGRIIVQRPVVSDGDEITLPCGVYFLTTASHRKPLKVMAR